MQHKIANSVNSPVIMMFSHFAIFSGVTWAGLLVAFIGKLAITISFNLILLVTVELYPSSIRAATLSMGLLFARIGAISAPWVVLIAQVVRKYLFCVINTRAFGQSVHHYTVDL